MARLHERYPDDTEASVFYALALLEAVDLTDKTYARQLKAAALLESAADRAARPSGNSALPHSQLRLRADCSTGTAGRTALRRPRSLRTTRAAHAVAYVFHARDVAGSDHVQPRGRCRESGVWGEHESCSGDANPATIVARYHALDFLVNAYLQLGQDALAKAIVDELRPVQAPATQRVHYGEYGLGRHSRCGTRFDRSAWREAASLRAQSPRPSSRRRPSPGLAARWEPRAAATSAGAKQALAQIAARFSSSWRQRAIRTGPTR